MPRIIGIISFKGGVGKTSSAVHIAGHLAERGKTVAVDGDDRNRSMMTDRPPQPELVMLPS